MNFLSGSVVQISQLIDIFLAVLSRHYYVLYVLFVLFCSAGHMQKLF